MDTNTHRIALLIDADNVSVDVLREVLRRLELAGERMQHRRAYGSVQKAGEFAEICRNHAIRFLPSTFAGPNATDIAMAIDAVEMMLRQPVDEVVIVSSDMDYSPLIVRLRELGARVTGYGQAGKSGRDIERDYERVYDCFEVIGPSKARPPARAGGRPARPQRPSATPAPVSAPMSAHAPASAAKPVSAPVPMPSPAPAEMAAPGHPAPAEAAVPPAASPPARGRRSRARGGASKVAVPEAEPMLPPVDAVASVAAVEVPAAAPPEPAEPAGAPARPASARRRSAAKTAVKAPAAQAAVADAVVAQGVNAASTDPVTPRALPAAVEDVLAACPDLRGGAPVRLNGVAVALRERGLLTKSGKTTSFFKKLDKHFELLPADKPESVRLLSAAPDARG